MVRFAMRLSNISLVKDHFVNLNKRFDNKTSVLLSGGVDVLSDKEFCYVFIDFNILAPPFFWIFVLGFVATLLLVGFGWYSYFLIALSGIGLFWTQIPYKWMIKKGLRKSGYKGEVLIY